jgi:hypothetical protein
VRSGSVSVDSGLLVYAQQLGKRDQELKIKIRGRRPGGTPLFRASFGRGFLPHRQFADLALK